MHVLVLGPDWQITARFRQEFVADMRALGWRVTIAAAGERQTWADAFLRNGVECVDLPSDRNAINPLKDLALIFGVYRVCRTARPDAVVAFSVKPVTFGLIGARLGRVPVRTGMITGVGYALMEGRELKRRMVRLSVTLLYRLSLRGCSRLFFQNGDDVADFRRLKLASLSTVATRTNGSGVDLQRFSSMPLPVGPLTFIMVARLLREKGVHEFVGAARLAKRSRPDLRFILVGPLDSNPTAISQEELDDLAAEGVVEYLGPRDDVRPHLADAHVFILPSYREGTPRSALEALAMARPVITVDVPGCREVVVDYQTGRLVAPRSAEAVAEAVEWFATNTDLIPAMAARARHDAEQRFDVHAVNRVITEALEEDVKTRRGFRAH